ERLIADRGLGNEPVRAGSARVRIVPHPPIAFPQKLLRSGRTLDAEQEVAAIGSQAYEARDRDFLITAVLGISEAKTDLRTLEIVLQNEVDDTADGVRAVHGRRAARDHLDTLDRGGGDGVRVHYHRRVDRHRAPPVDQNEIP